MRELARRFHLLRLEDVHGVSGEGVVAEGVQFTNGFVALTWLTPLTSVTFFLNIQALEAIHGHEGRTQVRWDDEAHEPAPPEPREEAHMESEVTATKSTNGIVLTAPSKAKVRRPRQARAQ